MALELSKEDRQQAIESIQRYFRENFDQEIGNIGAGALLGFFLEEVGPLAYNKAVKDVQSSLERRVLELDIEIHEDEFQYWSKQDGARRRR
ncbi:MAG TPA: DUF2164 domain-containing protein [Noviherbaspirillum sp.]|nr:DUF2164 domain-containing protein [Noviherbaspirillum sp.]